MINNNSDNYYLDACSTSPPLQSVIDEISRVQRFNWGNSSSIHLQGIDSCRILEESRILIASKLGLNHNQILFTHGATDSIDKVFQEITRKYNTGRIISGYIEHPAVLNSINKLNRSNWKICYLPVDNYGIYQIDNLNKILRPPTKLVSMIWGQSEIGSIQPIHKVSTLCKQRNIAFHIDATQVFSQGIPDIKDLYFDFISVSAHKFRGPKGVGMLIVNNKYIPNTTHTNNLFNNIFYSSGTTPVALIAGMANALENLNSKIKFVDDQLIFESNLVSRLTSKIKDEILNMPGIELLGHPTTRLPHHISVLVKDKEYSPIPAIEFVRRLSLNGISISTGTACSLYSNRESYALEAIGLKKEYRKSMIRLSLGDWITESNVDEIISIFRTTLSQF